MYAVLSNGARNKGAGKEARNRDGDKQMNPVRPIARATAKEARSLPHPHPLYTLFRS